jgi:hypothetical protein
VAAHFRQIALPQDPGVESAHRFLAIKNSKTTKIGDEFPSN